MTALAGHAPAHAVDLQCQAVGCPEFGRFVLVDYAALLFAAQERDYVRCGRCRRPLTTPRKTPVGTVHEQARAREGWSVS